MQESTKKDIRFIVILLASFGAYIAFTELVPDDSIIKGIFGVLMVVALVLAAIILTPIGNPLKRLYRKWRGIK